MGDLPPLATGQFGDFVHAVHGYEPFGWQHELLDALIDQQDRRNDVAVVSPPGLGKTVAVDAALFCLALQAHVPPSERTAPLRIVVTVNRRLVVDSITDHAVSAAWALARAWRDEPAGVLGAVAARLAAIAAASPDEDPRTPVEPVAVTRMHGGATWDRLWAAHPQQPLVVVATPDQVLSRLLFRGYGVSRLMLPIDAALLGVNTRLIIDEAHLSDAAAETVRDVIGAQQLASEPLAPSPLMVTMTATPRIPTSPSGHAHSDAVRSVDASSVPGDPVADVRLDASRMLHVHTTGRDLPEALTEAATTIAEVHALPLVGVVANTVATARAVHQRLLAEGHDADLLIGPSRAYDRRETVKRVTDLARVGRALASRTSTGEQQPSFVVATQTIEVGVDLDFDGLVSEACPLDAFAQRAGRLDRIGQRAQADLASPLVLVRHRRDHRGDAPVYGLAITAAFDWLADFVDSCGGAAYTGAKVVRPAKAGAFSWRTFTAALAAASSDQRRAAQAPSAPRPPLPWTLFDDWARTSPIDRDDHDIDVYVHGLTELSPTVQLCWRADLDPVDLAGSATLSVAALPPHPAELVEVTLPAARRWLSGLDPGPLGDTLTASQPPSEGRATQDEQIAWVDRDDTVQVTSPRRIPSDAVVLLPADLGGCDRYGFAPQHHEPVRDIADLARSLDAPTLRLHPRTLRNAAGLVSDEDPPVDRDDALVLFETVRQAELPDDLAALVTRLGATPKVRPATSVQRPDALLWTATTTTGHLAHRRLDDETSLTVPVNLDTHSNAVAEHAARLTEWCGLPEPAARAVVLAARMHDIGKLDVRFQAMLNGGGAPAAVPLAKSGMDPGDRVMFRDAAVASGWPQGMRHETVSLVLYRCWTAVNGHKGALDEDLVEHLIVTHHGYYRPLPPVLPHATPIEVTGEILGTPVAASGADIDEALSGWDGPARMARLTRRYNPWTLAHMETLVRLADIGCSKAGT